MSPPALGRRGPSLRPAVLGALRTGRRGLLRAGILYYAILYYAMLYCTISLQMLYYTTLGYREQGLQHYF